MPALARTVLAGSLGTVAYTFAGYPAIAAARARLRPRPVAADPAHTPRVSLIIAAHDEEDVIEEKLRGAARLDYPSGQLEVIVVADGSTDRTAERARGFAGVMVLHQPERRGKLAAIERGIAASSGELLLLSDANNRYDAAAVREIAAPFADPGVGVVSGRKAVDDGSGRALDRAEGLYWRYESRLTTWESAAGSVVSVAGEILAFRREAYRAPPRGSVTEDFVAAMLAAADGWRVVHAPRAVSLEPASATVADEAVRRARLVTGRWQAMASVLPRLVARRPLLAWQVVSHKALRPVVPWALGGTVISAATLARTSGPARALLGAQAIFYAAAVLGAADERAGRRTRRWAFLSLWFCRMNIAALWGTLGAVQRRDHAVWTRVRRG